MKKAVGALLLSSAVLTPTWALADPPSPQPETPAQPPEAPAQPPGPPKPETAADKAARLFLEGQDLKAKGEVALACARFSDSLALGGAVGPLLNLADCEERRGNLATALALWEKGLVALRALAEAEDERVALAAGRIASLVPRVPRVTVGSGAGRVVAGTVELPPGKPVPLDPGDHVLVVSAPGRADRVLRVTLAEREKRTIDATPGPPLAVPPPAPPLANAGVTGAAIASLVVGAAGLGTFAVTGALVVDRDARLAAACPNKVCTDPALGALAAEGRTLLGANAVALGVGLAGVGVGATLLIAQAVGGRRQRPVEGLKATPQASVTPGGAWLGVAGSY